MHTRKRFIFSGVEDLRWETYTARGSPGLISLASRLIWFAMVWRGEKSSKDLHNLRSFYIPEASLSMEHEWLRGHLLNVGSESLISNNKLSVFNLVFFPRVEYISLQLFSLLILFRGNPSLWGNSRLLKGG